MENNFTPIQIPNKVQEDPELYFFFVSLLDQVKQLKEQVDALEESSLLTLDFDALDKET